MRVWGEMVGRRKPWEGGEAHRLRASSGGIGASKLFGGHVNYQTFLKQVAYMGPKEEFVVTGSDSGHMFIFDNTNGSGNLCVDPTSERTCEIRGFYKADSRTCNGVAPHPFLPILASYGIDSDAQRAELYRSEANGVLKSGLREVVGDALSPTHMTS
jgi:hypothetical protein